MSESPPPQPSPIPLAAGVLLIVAAIFADVLGVGGTEGIGPRELALIVPGAALVGSQVWRGTATVSTRGCLLLWIWVGLAGGLLEAAQWSLIARYTGEIMRQAIDAPWMIPVTYLVVFTALGGLFAVVARLAPRLAVLPVVVLVPALIAAWSTICTFDWMHDLAGLALAGGVALTVGRASAASPAVFWRTVRATTVAMVALVLSLGVWIGWSTAAAERAAMAALPSPPAGAPNVLLIVLDTTRVDRFASHGAERTVMPRIDAFAESAVVFDHAIATAPWTLTSHVSLFTGKYPHQQNSGWVTPLDDAHRTIAEELSQHGYATGGFVANLGYCGPDSGLSRGFAHYEDYYVTPGVMVGSTKACRKLMNKRKLPPHLTLLRNRADQINERFLSWVSEQGERPFFAFLNYYDPHAMYIAPPPFDRQFGEPTSVLNDLHKGGARWSHWSASEAQTIIDGYDGCMAYMDHQIGLLLDELEARGVLDETLVIITSDHGELFGEHDLQEHQNCLYNALLHVPLFVRYPGLASTSQRVSETVSLVDIPATILDVIGIQPAAPMPGHSLAPLWSGDTRTPRSPALSEVAKTIRKPAHWPASKGDMSSLYLDGLHYIVNHGDGTQELYDVVADPDERENLLTSRPQDTTRMRAALDRALGK